MASQLTGAVSTVPGLVCPVDIVNPVVLYLHFNTALGYFDGLAWECTVHPNEHHGVMYPVPTFISVARVGRWNRTRTLPMGQ